MMNDNELQVSDHDDSDNTMAVLSSLSGGEADPEGQPLGLDPNAGKSKLSGSTLAVGAVVLLGVGALFAMKMTLKAQAVDATTAEAEQAIADFMNQIAATDASPDSELAILMPMDQDSERIISELQADPTDHQVPTEQVEKNPFELMGLAAPPPDTEDDTSEEDELRRLERELEGYQTIARAFEIGGINGKIVFIDGEMLRIGDTIGDTGFTVANVEGLDVVVRVPAEASRAWAFRLHYE